MNLEELIDEMIEKQQFKIDFLESEIVDDFMVQEIELRNEFIKSLQLATTAEVEIEKPYYCNSGNMPNRVNCKCGYKLVLLGDNYCSGCGSKIKWVEGKKQAEEVITPL